MVFLMYKKVLSFVTQGVCTLGTQFEFRKIKRCLHPVWFIIMARYLSFGAYITR